MMKKYIGTKVIWAEPSEKDGFPGYKVIYKDGYESWSPKEVFEQFYRLFEELDFDIGNNIVDYQARVAQDRLKKSLI